MRRDDFSRRMMREHSLSADNLIYPIFVLDGKGVKQPVASMPGVERRTVDLIAEVAEQCMSLGVPVLALFPVIDPALKTPAGRIAPDPDGLVLSIAHAGHGIMTAPAAAHIAASLALGKTPRIPLWEDFGLGVEQAAHEEGAGL